MTQIKRARRPGRKRWGELVKFLTQTMKGSTNERVRMAAAMRLADILSLREEREQLELRRELRLLTKTGGEPAEEAPATETTDEFLARVKAERMKGTENEF